MPANNTPHDIFISYSRKNKDAVLPIKGEIERTLGLKCWIDLSDIPCGSENFKRKVILGIRQTRIAFLFFLTVGSQMPECAMKEIVFAGILVFTGLRMYDAQKIKHLAAQEGTLDSTTVSTVCLMGALTLYLDFINLFLYILRLLGKKR